MAIKVNIKDCYPFELTEEDMEYLKPKEIIS